MVCIEGVDLAALDAADEGVTAEEYLESLLEEAGDVVQFQLLRGIYVAIAQFPSVKDAQKVRLGPLWRDEERWACCACLIVCALTALQVSL